MVTPLSRFHRILLTSDGVHEYVDLDTTETIISSDLGDLDKCKQILQNAKKHGSTDDLSVVIISI